MSAFAKRVRYSSPLKTGLDEECDLLSIPFVAPERNVATRWNSTISMIDSMVPLREPMNNLCDRVPNMRKYKLTEDEWEIILQLQPVLKVQHIL